MLALESGETTRKTRTFLLINRKAVRKLVAQKGLRISRGFLEALNAIVKGKDPCSLNGSLKHILHPKIQTFALHRVDKKRRRCKSLVFA